MSALEIVLMVTCALLAASTACTLWLMKRAQAREKELHAVVDRMFPLEEEPLE